MALSLNSQCPLLLLLSLFSLAGTAAVAAELSVPPLQWIELTQLMQGDQPPALKDASIGYDQTSNTIILFGGEQNNVAQSNTYLLNLLNFTWRAPSPPSNLPATLKQSPPPRSAAIFGPDIAASYRRAFVVVGGRGTNNAALSDVWAFDFGSEIWAEMQLFPGGPSPRWGASGGIDFRTPTTQDPKLAAPNNTFYLSGGNDGSQAEPLTDTWKLSITGTLSSNNPDQLFGSWEKISGLKNLPRKDGQAGCVIGSTIIAYGGCNSTSTDGSQTCAQQDGYVISTTNPGSFSCQTCPAPRLGASIIPNLNTASDTFSSQAFLLEGTFDKATWDDGGGSKKGEIGVLSYRTGNWSRIIPAGDPGSTGTVRYPTPRQGAAVYALNNGLVGSRANQYTDTLMYGGQDADGNYLQDMWLLRAYDGSVSSSSAHWSGYGNGKLQSGVDANGAGVTNQFISDCATRISTPSGSPPSTSSTTSSSSPSSTSSNPPSQPSSQYTASTSHKALSAVSVLLIFPAILCYRIAFSARPFTSHQLSFPIFILFTTASYALAIGGLVLAFTSISSTSSLSKRTDASSSTLKTAHGKVALVFFLLVYALTPLLVGVSRCWTLIQSRSRRRQDGAPTPVEKSTLDAPRSRNSTSSSDHPHTRSLGPASVLTHLDQPEPRLSSDQVSTLSDPSPGTQRTFAVVNRGNRGRRGSHSGWLSARAAELSSDGHTGHVRSLSDVDWLARRRSLNAVGELDYAITIARRANETSTPGTMDQLMMSHGPKQFAPSYPFTTSEILIRLFFHISFLGLCGVTLAALWMHAPVGTFAAFLAVTVLSYLFLFIHAWRTESDNSLTYSLITRLRGGPPSHRHNPPHPSTPADADGQYPFPTSLEEQRSPYSWQQPAYRAATSTGHESTNCHDEPDDEHEDDDIRQRIMEEEMNRRDVSIVTVPKRRLWIANPEMQH